MKKLKKSLVEIVKDATHTTKVFSKCTTYGAGMVHCAPTLDRKIKSQHLAYLEHNWDHFYFQVGAYGTIAGYLFGTGLLCGMFGPVALLTLGVPVATQLSSLTYEGIRRALKKDAWTTFN